MIAILTAGFGKSLLYQLRPNLLPTKADNNNVIVVGPLNATIEDQLRVAKELSWHRTIEADHAFKYAYRPVYIYADFHAGGINLSFIGIIILFLLTNHRS